MTLEQRDNIILNASLEAVKKAIASRQGCGSEVGTDVIRGFFIGYAMAYRTVDPAGYAEVMREIAALRPSAMGMKPVVVVDNSRPIDAANRLGVA